MLKCFAVQISNKIICHKFWVHNLNFGNWLYCTLWIRPYTCSKINRIPLNTFLQAPDIYCYRKYCISVARFKANASRKIENSNPYIIVTPENSKLCIAHVIAPREWQPLCTWCKSVHWGFSPSKWNITHLWLFDCPVSSCPFYRASICEAVLGVVIVYVCLSVCPSVRLSHAWIVTNLNGALQIFWYHTKGQSLCYSGTNSGL